MLLNSGMNYIEGMRTVAKFSPKPFYFATTKGNSSGLIEELNAAIVSIEQADPSFPPISMRSIFLSLPKQLFLTGKEKNYIENAGKIKVGVLKTSLRINIWERMGRKRGWLWIFSPMCRSIPACPLNWCIMTRRSRRMRRLRTRRFPLVACMPYEYALARSKGVSMSRAYLSSQYLLVTREDGGTEQGVAGRRLALTNAATYQGKLLGNPSAMIRRSSVSVRWQRARRIIPTWMPTRRSTM